MSRSTDLPTDEDVALIRDAYLAAYVRRKPEAVPHPDTSLYAILEACAVTLAPILKLVPGSADLIRKTLAEDEETKIRPPEVEEVYDPKGKGRPEPQRESDSPKSKRKIAGGSSELGEWECAKKGEGSF